MARVIESLAAGRKFDVVQCEGTHLAAYMPVVRSSMPGVPIIFDWHNIESEGMLRYAELTSSVPRAAYARMTARRLAAVERKLLTETYGHTVCSEREQKQLNAISPGARIAVIGNGVDAEHLTALAASGDRRRIVFVGLMAYHANIDAVIWFVRNAWPGIRREHSDKILTIVGANPAPSVLALASEDGVEVTGTVPDVRPYYAEAYAAIAPLRTGAGTRLKIVEAMAAGVPVVSSAIGAEGLDVVDGRDILLAETAEDWRHAFTKLRDDAFRQNIVRGGRRTAELGYDWKMLRGVLVKIYEQWLNDGQGASGRA
jgi:glycosyltransferase involved in cell wall biosynthesis